MLKILFVLDGIGLGGSEVYNVSLMNKLALMGQHVDLCVLSNILNLKDKVDDSIRVYVLERRKKIDFKVIKELAKIINLNGYDIALSTARIYMLFTACLTPKPPITIYPIHFTLPSNKNEAIINFINFHTKLRREIYISSSENQTKFLKDYYKLSDGFFKQISNGIDTDFYNLPPIDFDKNSFLSNIGIKKSDKIILMVGGYKLVKNHHLAVDSFKLLHDKIRNLKLIFVGNDHYGLMSEVRNYAGHVSDSIITINDVDDERLRSFYWCADVFTLTSRSEAFPISALEAMATGLPCVLPDVGGMKDFVHTGINGELSTIGDANDISNKWEYVLENANVYSKFVIREAIKTNYSIDKSTSMYYNLMKQAINTLNK